MTATGVHLGKLMNTREALNRKRLLAKGLLLWCGGLAFAAGFLSVASPAAQVPVAPGSATRGERLLDEKGCLGCHALNGKGGRRAPDFLRSSSAAATPGEFASVMWNHSPRMFAEFEAEGRPVPSLSSAEVSDLFAFFYSSLYFSPKGEAARGRTLFEEKNCISCHSEVLNSRSRRSLLPSWTDIGDPLIWAERMWNHAGEMESAMSNRGLSWPRLSAQDIADLLTFLSGSAAMQPRAEFTVGQAEIGRVAFERSCESCHSFGLGAAVRPTVDLLAKSRPSSITGYIAAMWNHAPEMRRRGGSTPKLNAGEMPDLVAYLFAQRYFFDRGDVNKGRLVYEQKNCATCHENRSRALGAPDLFQSSEVYSPITLTSAVWRHGLSMMDRIERQGSAWPVFNGSEMADLIAYLNSKLITRVAR